MMIIKKGISLSILFVISISMFAQVSYHIRKDGRIDSLTYQLSATEKLQLLFDESGQVKQMDRLRDGLRDGFVYYFDRNRLDSIRRFVNGEGTSELYLMTKDGMMRKHVLLDGQDMDSVFSLSGRAVFKKPYSPLMGHNSQVFEIDSNGVIKRIYDVDQHSKTPYLPMEYDVYLPGGYKIYTIINHATEEVVSFSNGKLTGVYTYQNGEFDGFRLLFVNHPKARTRELTFWEKGKIKPQSIRFKRNGKIRG